MITGTLEQVLKPLDPFSLSTKLTLAYTTCLARWTEEEPPLKRSNKRQKLDDIDT